MAGDERASVAGTRRAVHGGRHPGDGRLDQREQVGVTFVLEGITRELTHRVHDAEVRRWRPIGARHRGEVHLITPLGPHPLRVQVTLLVRSHTSKTVVTTVRHPIRR